MESGPLRQFWSRDLLSAGAEYSYLAGKVGLFPIPFLHSLGLLLQLQWIALFPRLE